MENKPTEPEAIASDVPVGCEYPTKETGRELIVAPGLMAGSALVLHAISVMRQRDDTEDTITRSKKPLAVEKALDRLEIEAPQRPSYYARKMKHDNEDFIRETDGVSEAVDNKFKKPSVNKMIKGEFFTGKARSGMEQERNKQEILSSMSIFSSEMTKMGIDIEDQFNQLIERVIEGRACPNDRMSLFMAFSANKSIPDEKKLSSLELAQISFYGAKTSQDELIAKTQIEQAIANAGGELKEDNDFKNSKIRATDALPYIEEGSEFVKFKYHENSTNRDKVKEAWLNGLAFSIKRTVAECDGFIVKHRMKFFLDFDALEEDSPEDFEKILSIIKTISPKEFASPQKKRVINKEVITNQLFKEFKPSRKDEEPTKLKDMIARAKEIAEEQPLEDGKIAIDKDSFMKHLRKNARLNELLAKYANIYYGEDGDVLTPLTSVYYACRPKESEDSKN